jgi:hypothetical protein
MPEDVDSLIEKANAGDVEGLVALYEPNATLVAGPGQVTTGTTAIREAFNGFLDQKLELRVERMVAGGMGWFRATRLENGSRRADANRKEHRDCSKAGRWNLGLRD